MDVLVLDRPGWGQWEGLGDAGLGDAWWWDWTQPFSQCQWLWCSRGCCGPRGRGWQSWCGSCRLSSRSGQAGVRGLCLRWSPAGQACGLSPGLTPPEPTLPAPHCLGSLFTVPLQWDGSEALTLVGMNGGEDDEPGKVKPIHCVSGTLTVHLSLQTQGLLPWTHQVERTVKHFCLL